MIAENRLDKQMKKIFSSVVIAVLTLGFGNLGNVANAAGDAPVSPEVSWPSQGYFGSFDKSSLQRGLQVYTEVCSSCHGLRLLSYRDIGDLGFSPAEVKAYARQFEVMGEPNEDGETQLRPAEPADRFVEPYANEQEARALNNGALPPDLSLIVKARNTGKGNFFVNAYDMLRGRGYASGADYVYALLTGYEDPPAGVEIADGMYYNKWFSGGAIAMAQPIYEGDDFADGTEATIEQQARDVTSFLMWASEPRLEDRRAMGIKVLLFLAIFTIVLFLLKRRVWKDVH